MSSGLKAKRVNITYEIKHSLASHQCAWFAEDSAIIALSGIKTELRATTYRYQCERTTPAIWREDRLKTSWRHDYSDRNS